MPSLLLGCSATPAWKGARSAPQRFLFSGTTFQGCSLVTTSGATVSAAHNCTFSGSRLAASATGTGTIIRADLATLASCEDGVVATDGAALTLHSVFAVSTGSAAVAGNSSHACLCECALKSSLQPDVERSVDCVAAIEARSGGGVVDATTCCVTDGAGGVAARSSGSAATLHGCAFSGLSAYGALAHDGGSERHSWAGTRGCHWRRGRCQRSCHAVTGCQWTRTWSCDQVCGRAVQLRLCGDWCGHSVAPRAVLGSEERALWRLSRQARAPR
jgi:hypothetical protein